MTASRIWVSFTKTKRKAILQEHKTSEQYGAIHDMRSIPDGGSICLVCIAKTLNSNNSALQNTLKITQKDRNFFGVKAKSRDDWVASGKGHLGKLGIS